MSKLSCQEVRAGLGALLDDEKDVAANREIGAHLETCAACRAELERLRLTVAALRRLPDLPPPAGILAGVRAGLRPAPWHHRLLGRRLLPLGVPLGALATLLVVVGVALFQAHYPGMENAVYQNAPAPDVRKPAAGAPPVSVPEARPAAPAAIPPGKPLPRQNAATRAGAARTAGTVSREAAGQAPRPSDAAVTRAAPSATAPVAAPAAPAEAVPAQPAPVESRGRSEQPPPSMLLPTGTVRAVAPSAGGAAGAKPAEPTMAPRLKEAEQDAARGRRSEDRAGFEDTGAAEAARVEEKKAFEAPALRKDEARSAPAPARQVAAPKAKAAAVASSAPRVVCLLGDADTIDDLRDLLLRQGVGRFASIELDEAAVREAFAPHRGRTALPGAPRRGWTLTAAVEPETFGRVLEALERHQGLLLLERPSATAARAWGPGPIELRITALR